MNQNSKSSPQVLSPQLRRRLDRHFLACSATVGASIALAAGADEAKAQIVWSGPLNIQVPDNDPFGVYFDFDTNTVAIDPANKTNLAYDANIFDAYINTDANHAYHSVSFYGPNKAFLNPPPNMSLATASTTDGQTLKLAAGVVIGPSSTVFGQQNDLANQFYDLNQNPDTPPVGPKSGPPTGQWLGDGVHLQVGYIGFKFVDKNGQTDYGWFKVSFDPVQFNADDQSTTILAWAYNTSGGPITTGQIPEPSSVALALLGAGAAGLTFWRKKRTEAKKLES